LLAFDQARAIYLSNSDCSLARRISTDAGTDSAPAWSRDGTHLAYWSQAVSGGPVALIAVNADGTAPVVVANGLDPSVLNWPFVWAPDGRSLAYQTSAGNQIELDVVALDSGAPKAVDVGAPMGANPAWSPDGRTIAFRGGTSAADHGVWLVQADGSGAARRLSQVAGGDGAFADVQWSPDGRHLAYRAGSPDDYRIYVIGADGTNEHRLTTSSDNEMYPAWSPTGSRLVFGRAVVAADAATGTPPMFQLVVIGADGSDPVRLSHPPAFPGSWAWWPDESRLMAGAADGYWLVDPANAASPVSLPVGASTVTVDDQRLAP
jgi:TolB protein